MRFGVFYELQLPKPWSEDDEHRLFHEALEQVVLADALGIDYAWEVEHHFLEEYSHSSAPEVFLAAAAARTRKIRLGHGIRQVIANYNHPARTAETVATLDLVSQGPVDAGPVPVGDGGHVQGAVGQVQPFVAGDGPAGGDVGGDGGPIGGSLAGGDQGANGAVVD